MVERTTIIELLDAERHDRSRFSSGVSQIDNFLQRSANKHSKAGNVRVYVQSAKDELIGFYAINVLSVDTAGLPKRFERTRPAHGEIPAAIISMIGVDERFQGRGHGGELLVDALGRIGRLATEIGIAIVILDVLDCGNPEQVERRKQLYLRYGFAELLDTPSRLFLPVAAIHAASAG